MRSHVFILVPVLVTALLPAGATGTPGAVPQPATEDIQRGINDLFYAAQYDSILKLIPGYIRRAEAGRDSVLLGRMYAQRGRVLTMTGRVTEARDDLDLGIYLAEVADDTLGLMPAVHYKGFFYTSEGRYDDAMRCFERRLELARLVRSPVDEALARSSIGYVWSVRGDNARAREEYTRAIMLFRGSARPQLETTPLIGLGRIEGAVGNVVEARRCYQRAWVVARASGDRVNEMWATNNLGVLETSEGDPGRAAAYSQRAFDIAREIGYPHGMVIPAVNLAKRAEELGEFARAGEILTEARDVCQLQGAREFLDMVDFSLAELHIAEGRYAAAGAIFRRLLAEPGRLEAQHRDFAVIGRARVLAHDDSVSQAIALLVDNFESRGAKFDAHAGPQANILLSHLLERSNDTAAALRYAQRARMCPGSRMAPIRGGGALTRERLLPRAGSNERCVYISDRWFRQSGCDARCNYRTRVA